MNVSALPDQVQYAPEAISLVRLPLALNLGITGHRPNRLPADVAPIRARLAQVLRRIGVELEGLTAGEQRLCLLDSLALGADVMAADLALEQGFELDVCLPFERHEYARDFEVLADRIHFESLLEQASRIIELPGSRASQNAAYEAAGLAMLSQSDLVIAVWNGERAAGRGGTADIVARAVEDNIPVIHIPTDSARAVEIVWAGLADAPVGRQSLWMVPRFAFDANVARLVAMLAAKGMVP